jgi:16S rRNA (guanine966-N2)-methyltransferase
MLPGANCLDLYAGTGVLGFEALSRGAAYVEMVDQSLQVVRALQSTLNQLQANNQVNNAFIYKACVPKQLPIATRAFDIVFLDPPYKKNVLLPCCYYLEEHGYLAELAYLYLEAERIIKNDELPANWQLIKGKQAGQVAYHLVKRVKRSG